MPRSCPRCGRADTVRPIRYGYPSEAMEAAAARGEVILGGCRPSDATHGCEACGEVFVVAPDADDNAPRS